jgi:hypothetical protein
MVTQGVGLEFKPQYWGKNSFPFFSSKEYKYFSMVLIMHSKNYDFGAHTVDLIGTLGKNIGL